MSESKRMRWNVSLFNQKTLATVHVCTFSRVEIEKIITKNLQNIEEFLKIPIVELRW